MKEFNKMISSAITKINESQRTCEICGDKETVHNVMLKYDNGKIMCDECAFKFYEKEEELG